MATCVFCGTDHGMQPPPACLRALRQRVAELEAALSIAAERDRALTNQADDWERALREIAASPKNIWEREIAHAALKAGER